MHQLDCAMVCAAFHTSQAEATLDAVLLHHTVLHTYLAACRMLGAVCLDRAAAPVLV